MSVRQGGKIIAGNVSHYNVGDTFMTKRTDNRLNGAVECDGATYNTTDFTGNGSIGELLEAGKLDYVSLSAYSNAIAQTGWCDKIGWDGTGNTAFRVPTINPRHYIIKTQEPTAENNYTWYKLYANGWVEQGGVANTTNTATPTQCNLPIAMIDGGYCITYGPTTNNMVSVFLAGKSTTYFSVTTGVVNVGYYAVAFNWQVSGMSSITPRTATRVMIQIANGITDQALETCTGVLSDVAGLKDLSNITADGKEVCANLAMPSNRYIDLTLGASGAAYTAPADGYFSVVGTTTAQNGFFSIGAQNVGMRVTQPDQNTGLNAFVPASKGATCTLYYSSINVTSFRFIYAEGAQ